MGAMPPEMMEAMTRWQEHAEINEHHKHLQKGEGSWLVQSKWWQGPGAPPEENAMISQIRPIMGGHFMLEEMSGLMEMAPGQQTPWNGMAITGYDNHKEQYVFVWFDNMTSSIMMGYGDQTGRHEWTYEYDAYDPMVGAEVSRKNVITEKNDNEQVFDMYTKQPDGSWFKNMEMTYLRAH